MPVEHFKSKEAYRENMAYRHIHGIPFTAKEVVVGGRSHEVQHSEARRHRDMSHVTGNSKKRSY